MSKYQSKTINLMGKNIILKEADPKDGQLAFAFLKTVSEETPFTYNYPGQEIDIETLAKRFANEMVSPHNLRLFAIADGQIIGQIGFWRLSPDHPWLKHKAEFAMMVIKECWGSGLAKELLNEMEVFARSIGISRIEATVNCANERGVSLYQKFGFAIEGKAIAYKIVDGVTFDSFYIAKLI